MEKIIVAIDGLKYAEPTVKYSILLARQCNAHLVGVFLEDFAYQRHTVQELVESEGNLEERRYKLTRKDDETRQLSVYLFENACREAGVMYTIHRDQHIAIQELLHESVFAGLLLIGDSETFTNYTGENPSRFMRELLSKVQCPVLIVPEHYHPIEKIIMLYNDEPSSVFAMRTFNHLFNSLNRLPVEAVSARGSRQELYIPDNRLMKEFMRRRFPEATYCVLQGEAEDAIIKHIKAQGQHIIIVMGAYGRSTLSRWLRPGMADSLLKVLQVPLFVAHTG